jgi:hypothetical protein
VDEVGEVRPCCKPGWKNQKAQYGPLKVVSNAGHVTRSDKNLKKCCISSTLDGTVDDVFGMAMKKLGMLALSVRKIKIVALVVDICTNDEDGEDDTDWLN